MKRKSGILKGMLCGGISGLLVLGVAFRLLTAGMAYLKGSSLNLSIKNVTEVLFVGCLTGVFGGISLVLTESIFKLRGPALVAVNSVFLMVVSFALASIGKSGPLKLTGSGWATLITVVAMLILYNAFALALIKNDQFLKGRSHENRYRSAGFYLADNWNSRLVDQRVFV